MSESRNNFGRKSITPKTKKLHPRVDLIAMVSVSFLLIIFFMLTSYLSKPQIMDLGMPGHRVCGGYYGCGESAYFRTMTLLLGDNDEIVIYTGDLYHPFEEPKTLSFNKNSLRKELIDRRNLVVQNTGNPRKGLIVLIKPSEKSNFKNLVDVLDEMAIVKIRTYAVVDIIPEEIELLESK